MNYILSNSTHRGIYAFALCVCTYVHINIYMCTYIHICLYIGMHVWACVCVHVEAEVHAPVTFTAVIHLLSETPLLLSVETLSVYGPGWSRNCYMVQV